MVIKSLFLAFDYKTKKKSARGYFLDNLATFDELTKYCITGDIETFKRTVNSNVNYSVDDVFGMSPLLIATLFNHPEIVELLIQRGADTNFRVQKTLCKKTAIQIAIYYD